MKALRDPGPRGGFSECHMTRGNSVKGWGINKLTKALQLTTSHPDDYIIKSYNFISP
jgi:hypothetical protein